MQDFFKI